MDKREDCMAEHHKLGQKGEEKAVEYLRSKGYNICKLNWRYKHKEIDIVATKDNWLVIVEVKTRSSFAELRELISSAKMHYLVEAANAYVEEYKRKEEVRFDVIFIHKKNRDVYDLQHTLDAFNVLDVC